VFKARVVRAWKCEVSKTKLRNAAQSRHFRHIDDQLLKAGYCHMTVDGVDDRGHDD